MLFPLGGTNAHQGPQGAPAGSAIQWDDFWDGTERPIRQGARSACMAHFWDSRDYANGTVQILYYRPKEDSTFGSISWDEHVFVPCESQISYLVNDVTSCGTKIFRPIRPSWDRANSLFPVPFARYHARPRDDFWDDPLASLGSSKLEADRRGEIKRSDKLVDN